MEIALGLFGAITGLAGIIFSLVSLANNRMEAVSAYYSSISHLDFVRARTVVSNLPDTYDPRQVMVDHGGEIAIVIAFCEQAGLLIKKRYLPFWLFAECADGEAAVKYYSKLKKYIEFRREQDNLKYAVNFEYLSDRIMMNKKQSRLEYKHRKVKKTGGK